MRTIWFFLVNALATILVAPELIAPAPMPENGFTLAGAIPNDVFLYVAERHNPERDFLGRYWGEVCEALAQSGIGEDLFDLFGTLLGAEHTAEVERLKERASRLLARVDWKGLAAKETVFAERLPPPMLLSNGVVAMPHMVWVLRGSGEGAAQNYEGLVAILEAMVDEMNRILGGKPLIVERSSRPGGKVSVAKLTAAVPDAVVMPLVVALHGDLVIIAAGEEIVNDVLDLLDGRSSKKSLANDGRFQAAFAELPAAEDSMVFFDMQALVRAIRLGADTVLGIFEEPGDVYRNTSMGDEAGNFHAAALGAYRRGDFKEALAQTKQAYSAGPKNSIILYNLACFTALNGQKDEALAWLEKAVDGGFHAPRKIARDHDLESLRGEAKYKAALAKAAELAERCCAEDIVINSTKTGEAYPLTLQAWQAYERKDYEQGLKLVEQAYAVAPKDSRVLYYLACFHALLGHEDKALGFLERAVDGGFYCARHISKDTDLEILRSHKRYRLTLDNAGKRAAELAAQKEGDRITLAKRLVARVTGAMGVLDYSASVETTHEYAIAAESITVLTPGAKDSPIYPVFGKRHQLTDFDTYLPQETASFSVSGGLDVGELYKFLEDSFRGGGPLGKELLAKWAEFQKQFGVNIQKDVVDWIDGHSISVKLADGSGSVWLLKVTDEKTAGQKVGAALEFLSTKLPEVIAKKPALAGLAMLGVRTSPVEHEQLEGFENLHVAMALQPLAVWGVADGYLIFGTSADTVASCLATAKGEHPSIRGNTRAMSEAIVPAGPFASVSLTDQRGLGEELAAGFGVASMVYGMIGTFVPEPKVRPAFAKIAGMLSKLAPVMRHIDFYKSRASYTTFDGQMWRCRGLTHYFSPAERAVNDTD